METRLTFIKNFSTEYEEIYTLLSDLYIFPKIYARAKKWLVEERGLSDGPFTKFDLNNRLIEISEVKRLHDKLIHLIEICQFNLKCDFIESLRSDIKIISNGISLDNMQEIDKFKIFLQNELRVIKEFMEQNHKISSWVEIAAELSGSVFNNALENDIDYASTKLAAFKFDLLQRGDTIEIVKLVEEAIMDLKGMKIVRDHSKNTWFSNADQISPNKEKYLNIKTHLKTIINHIIKLLKNGSDNF
jgi:hypothetical protein